MIKKLRVDNFKALNNFDISFTPFTVIVGNNSSGKSSVIQALDFLTGSVNENFDITLERRNLSVQSVKSKLKNSSKMQFWSQVELQAEEENRTLEWGLEIVVSGQKQLLLSKEQVVDSCTKDVLLSFETGKGGKLKGNRELEVPDLSYKMSILNLIDAKKDKEIFPELAELKLFWEQGVSFEMLTPEKMRLSSRGTTDTIGREGDKLPSFIKSMNEKQQEHFQRKLDDLLNGKMKSVSAKTKGKPGWTILEAQESYKNKDISVTSGELSDGMLRLLAFIAISEMDQKYSFMMLDEIENGINVNYSEKLMGILKNASTEKNQQFIMTTHSTVFVDYIGADEIVYLFRDDDTGSVRAVPLFEIPSFKERLENFYPGEILLNLSNEEILREIMSQS